MAAYYVLQLGNLWKENMVEDTTRGVVRVKRNLFLIFFIATILMAQPAFAESYGVHMHNQPDSTEVLSNKVVADTSGNSSSYIKQITVSGNLQPADDWWLNFYTYDNWANGGSSSLSLGSDSFDTYPKTIDLTSHGNYFAASLEVTTAESSTGCTLLYVTSITNNNGYTTEFTPLTCDVTDPGDPDPPTPPPPPDLPSPPVIPDAPSFNITEPNLPSGDIDVPGPGSFDGTYNYQEPDREGPYTYTPPALDVPEPIPSPPPPPEGPGLFDFSSIMQSLGTVEGQRPIEQPDGVETPVTQGPPGMVEAPQSVQAPNTGDEPIGREAPGAVDDPNVSEPTTITPIQQITTPLSVQSPQVDPATVQDVMPSNNPLQPEEPLTPEPITQ